MKKRFLCTIVYMLLTFIVYLVIVFLGGSENPFLVAGQWVIPLGVGYYIGWGNGQGEIRNSYNWDD